jgi:GNAT superfamily N-acetyltransferase
MSFQTFPMRNESDRLGILHLWRENLGDPRIRSVIDTRWRWMSELNPAGPVKMCVVVDSATDAVVGAAAALPRRLWVRGHEIKAAVLCDFVVDKSHRTAGPAVALQRTLARTCFQDGIGLLYGFPNDRAFPVVARIGYKTVGMATMWFRPLQASRKLREYVPEPLARVAGAVIDGALMAHEFQCHLRRKKVWNDSTHRTPNQTFLDLWDRGKAFHRIAGERTPAYLSWRYAQHPIEQCGFFCLSEKHNEQLRAYVAYSVLDGKVNVLDAFWETPDVLQPLFVGFVRSMRAMGHASVSVCHVGDSMVLRPLRKLGFIQSSQQRRFICKVGDEQNTELAQAAYDASQWSLFDGELDL